ncbi:MAG: hypothetical protein ACYTG2_19010 [Planctomycetota bacterium]|jgi:hypothetical protein
MTTPSGIRRSGFTIVLTIVLLVFAAPVASGQCFGPDGLDLGGCCAPVQANLPNFPSVSMPGLGICWDSCSVAGTNDLSVDWLGLAQGACGRYQTLVTVSDTTTGVPILTGTLVLDYTRTWLETDPAGNTIQVWRFLAKGDLQVAATGVTPTCPVPPCILPSGPWQTAFFYGYLDYAVCDPTTGYENALVLYHACDRFIHAPGLSDKPGTFHPENSYAIVAPHSAAQPFVPSNAIAPGGLLMGEAVRTANNPAIPPTLCTVEDRIVDGGMVPLGAGCVCTLSTFPKQQTVREFFGKTNCVNAAGVPGGWTSLAIAFPTLPWLHMVTTSIGGWGNPFSYPGQELAWVDEGLFVHQDPCVGDFIELKYGASTRFGWDVLLPTPVVVNIFTDLADNWSAPLSGPYPGPVLGSVQLTDRLIYVNLP